MAQTLQEPTVRVSTLLGMAVMDAFDAGATNGAIMLHDVPRALREQTIARLIAAGWEAKHSPRNGGMRGARDPKSGTYVSMWLAPDDRCPECGGSGVDSVMAGERCMLCKGHG